MDLEAAEGLGNAGGVLQALGAQAREAVLAEVEGIVKHYRAGVLLGEVTKALPGARGEVGRHERDLAELEADLEKRRLAIVDLRAERARLPEGAGAVVPEVRAEAVRLSAEIRTAEHDRQEVASRRHVVWNRGHEARRRVKKLDELAEALRGVQAPALEMLPIVAEALAGENCNSDEPVGGP